MQIRLEQGTDMGNWLLQPLRESNLQLFALVSLWISNKVGFHTFFPVNFRLVLILMYVQLYMDAL